VHNPSIFATAIIFLKILTHLSVVVDYTDRQATPLYSPNKLVRLLSFFSENLFLRTMENWLTDSKDLEDNVRRVRKKKEVNIMLYRSMIPQSASLNSKTKTLPLEIAPNKVNIAYSGALLYDHGVDILIDAFSELPLDKVHLYITGHGPARPTLEDKIKREKLAENVTITFLDNEVFDDFLLRMDILVIPYRDTKKIRLIGFPSKILSYTWAGKAIIATNTTELPDLLKHGETANLVSPDSKEALKDALVELVTNKERRKELGLNARKYFDDNLSPEVVGPSINDYLLTVVNSHKD
jgi:glycosyltransferase involved in cell wall biosynthesis